MPNEYDDMILPDDFEVTPSEENQEEVEETEQQNVETEETPSEEVQQQEPTQEQQPIPQTIKIKFNHEEKEIGIDEAAPLIQKGMNYDKVTEQLNSLKSDPRLTFVEELAQANNMTVEEYITAVKETQHQQEIQKLVEQNIPEDIAREMLENRKFRQEQTQKQKAEAEQKAQQASEQKNIAEFKEAYPDVTADKIPDEVLDKARQGMPLKAAYMEYELSQLKNEIKILKQNQTNQKKAPVGRTAVHGSTDVDADDDFLRGFGSVK